MAATDDPKTTITNTIIANLGNITLDAGGITIASVGIMWEGGPETFKYLFHPIAIGGADFDVVITIGDPRSRSVRPIQDVPVHYMMRYPVTVTSVDKPLWALPVVSTASRVQYKVTYALRAAIAVTAQSGLGATPAFTMKLVEDVATHKRIAGLDVWQATHYVEYETDYA